MKRHFMGRTSSRKSTSSAVPSPVGPRGMCLYPLFCFVLPNGDGLQTNSKVLSTAALPTAHAKAMSRCSVHMLSVDLSVFGFGQEIQIACFQGMFGSVFLFVSIRLVA